MENNIEERLLSVERRLEALLKSLSDEHKNRIEIIKDEMVRTDGNTYTIQAIIETDLGEKTIKFDVKGWSDKQALFYANRDIIFPNMSKLQSEGKIKWFKTLKKEIILKPKI
jgi:hypothetical protein